MKRLAEQFKLNMPLEQQQVPFTWNRFQEPRPYIGVMGFAYDDQGRFPILLRSDKVRSAKNAWSIITGLHEVGRNIFDQFSEECKEELNLQVGGIGKKIGYFEAIIHEDHWHWIMLLVAMKVRSFDSLLNKEPDKHSEIKLISVDQLFTSYLNINWTPGTKNAFLEYHKEIIKAIKV